MRFPGGSTACFLKVAFVRNHRLAVWSGIWWTGRLAPDRSQPILMGDSGAARRGRHGPAELDLE